MKKKPKVIVSGHNLNDLKELYPLPARLVKDLEGSARRPAPLLAAASFGLFMIFALGLLSPDFSPSSLILLLLYAAVPAAILWLVLRKTIVALDDTWQTLRKVLETLKPGDDLLPGALEVALTLDMARQRAQEIYERAEDKGDELHPDEVMRDILDRTRNELKEQRDPEIRAAMQQSVERLEKEMAAFAHVENDLALLDRHLALIGQAEVKLLAMLGETTGLYQQDEQVRAACRRALPRVSHHLAESEARVLNQVQS